MRKYIPISIGSVLLATIVALNIAPNENPSYAPRIDSEKSGSEPFFMSYTQVDVSTGEIDPMARAKAMRKVMNHATASRANDLGIEFVSKGPDNLGGRTRAILEVYKNPSRLIVGSVTGGLWTSSDGGGSWQQHEQFINLDSTSSIISAIHQDTIKTSPYYGRIYVGTGSSYENAPQTFQAWPGNGLFISDDEGETFEKLSSTSLSSAFNASDPWVASNRIRTDGSGNVYVAGRAGLKRSEDGGETWEDAILTSGGAPLLTIIADVIATKANKVIAATSGGILYVSETGLPGSFEQVSQGGMPTGISRVVLSYSESNDAHIYAMFTGSDDCLHSIWESNDGGELWTQLLVPHDDFIPMFNGEYCQGSYDDAFGVSPIDDNLMFIGGVTIWRYDGNLTRVAFEGGSPPFQDVLPNYVHADKHYVYFSPNDPSRVYVTSDGAIATSTDDGETWSGMNKGYNSTQFYSIAYSNDGDLIFGGTQDNGTLITMGGNWDDPNVGFELTGGDGMGCDMSQISTVLITTSQNGATYRIDATGNDGTTIPPLGRIGFEGGPFVTKVRLWENIDEPTSRDSIIFAVNTTEVAFDVSNGAVKSYTGDIIPTQASAIIIKESISVYSGDQELTVSATDNEVLEGTGSSSGTITYNEDGSFVVNVDFEFAPSENSNVYVSYDQRFEANSVIVIESDNYNTPLSRHQFEHRLENDLLPGDFIKVQDPVQTMLAATTGSATANGEGGVRIFRNVLNFSNNPGGIDIPGITGAVSSLEWTSDGDVLFVGTRGGSTFRVSGMKQLYTAADANNLTVTPLSAGDGGPVMDICVDPSDDNRVAVVTAGYNSFANIRLSSNALAAAPTFANIQNDLPAIPIYAVMIDRNDPNTILIGTEFGLWGTNNAGDVAPNWVNINNEFTSVPTYAVRQQKLPWDQAKNTGMIFVGTYGAGMWKSESLLGVDDYDALPTSKEALSDLKVFPNPMTDVGYVELESNFNGNVDVAIFDINGRQVKSSQERVVSGTNVIKLNTSGLSSGTYYTTVISGETRKVAKMMIF